MATPSNAPQAKAVHPAILAAADAGLLRTAQHPERALRLQHSALKRLLGRIPKDASESYLTSYDSMMRLLEIATLQMGKELGNMPHRALKDVLLLLTPDTRINEVVQVRHAVKKNGRVPSQDEFDTLISERKKLAEGLRVTSLLEQA